MNNQWKLVPVEPTREMLVAALKTNGACPIYAAMLASAPVAPQSVAEPAGYLHTMHYESGSHRALSSYESSEFVFGLPDVDYDKSFRVSVEPLYTRLDAGEVARLTAERDALQLRLNAADQRIDELTVPAGYCLMPTRLTAENGAKDLLLGEFRLEVTTECPECREHEEPMEGCEICDGEGEYGQRHMIPWDKIKFIYSEAVKGLAIKPNTPR
ncbi:hypothetical protein HNO86_00785 [Pseudomonas sp. C1C7]|uniref:hypothetical protein n=1 Tax=Pseudomonas sp. C1C7 TaxID=2735272 RepID=UPI001586F4BA|nr:hypothetical protein [Pseudomonas sp. C1C7]NUT73568.1 hypothetical protein [Pseudomonas sp. C1C7]